MIYVTKYKFKGKHAMDAINICSYIAVAHKTRPYYHQTPYVLGNDIVTCSSNNKLRNL